MNSITACTSVLSYIFFPLRITHFQAHRTTFSASFVSYQVTSGQSKCGSRPASWKCILSPGFQDRSRRDPKYVPRARHFYVIEVIILPFQICDRIFQRVTSDSIKCNGSFVRSLYGRICRGGQGGDREIARDRGWLRGVVWSGRVESLHVCTNHN